VAARLREAGKRRDAAELCRAIDLLGAASRRIREALREASLLGTGYQALETALFGAPAEQALAWPKLLRAIGATADLVEGGQGQAAPPLEAIEPFDTRRNWCAGRLLQLPRVVGRAAGLDALTPALSRREREQEAGRLHHNEQQAGRLHHKEAELRFVLSGECGEKLSAALTTLTPALSRREREQDAASPAPSPREREQARMQWVLSRPWILLLAQVAFTQEAWEAEQISGRLALELADDQLANPYLPGRVDVVVTTAEGDEVVCGTLGQLVLRVLARLDVTLLARPEQVARLDEYLAAVVRLLLEKKVWRFEPRAAGGRRPGYVIDDEFSTSCYRAFGSKHFYRGASVLSSAIRQACEQWVKERLASGGAVVMTNA